MSLANFEQNAVLRKVQQARAVAKCIRIAADDPDNDLDLSDAVGGLVMLLEGAIDLLDPPGGAP